MRFDVYGRFRVDIERRDGAWVVYRVGAGTRAPMPDLVVPADVAADKLEDYLNDLLHELATPGREIRRVG